MREVLVKFDEPIMNQHGDMYFAEAIGRQRADDGLWEGWLEFSAIDESRDPIFTERETTQPNRREVEYWAQGLSLVYLQGALARAEAFAVTKQAGDEERIGE